MHALGGLSLFCSLVCVGALRREEGSEAAAENWSPVLRSQVPTASSPLKPECRRAWAPACLSEAEPTITLYTHTACPFAQRVWIALEASGMSFKRVDVNLYGTGGFDKSKLKEVEAAGGLRPKGYIPVLAVGDQVLRESSDCVDRVAVLSTEVGATPLEPENAAVAQDLVTRCNALPKSTSSAQLDELLRRAEAALAESPYLAGSTFSRADACLLPFLQRVDDDGGLPSDAVHLRDYMARMRRLPAFRKTVVSGYWWWW